MSKYLVVGNDKWDMLIIHADRLEMTNSGVVFSTGNRIVLIVSPRMYTTIQQYTDDAYENRDPNIRHIY